MTAKTAPPLPRGGPCSFCGHPAAIHSGNELHRLGCAAPQCPKTSGIGSSGAKIGRCALYTSPSAQARQVRWQSDSVRTVSLNAQELAQEIHFVRFGNRYHSPVSSCSCTHEAVNILNFKLHPKRAVRP